MRSVYRLHTPPTPSSIPRPWRRIFCWVVGHVWCVTKEDPLRCAALANLHPLAGCDAYCMRCGATWLDVSQLEQIRRDMMLLEERHERLERIQDRLSRVEAHLESHAELLRRWGNGPS